MTTITREFTKEQLIAKAQEQIEFIRRAQVTGAGREHVDMCAALFEIALASLDAKARKVFTCSGCGAEGLDEPLESRCHCGEDGAHWVESVVYTAPPALQEHRKADMSPKKYNIGNLTMRHVFEPAGITDVSDLQAVFEQVETALSSLERGLVVWVGFDLAKDEVSALQGNQASVKQLSSDCPKCGGYGTYHCPQMLGTVECECTLPEIPQQEAE
ncbi:hypothetical protein BSI30_15460 [Salmonella enterica]|nr:hypothetical protein [Salmonella enterica]